MCVCVYMCNVCVYTYVCVVDVLFAMRGQGIIAMRRCLCAPLNTQYASPATCSSVHSSIFQSTSNQLSSTHPSTHPPTHLPTHPPTHPQAQPCTAAHLHPFFPMKAYAIDVCQQLPFTGDSSREGSFQGSGGSVGGRGGARGSTMVVKTRAGSTVGASTVPGTGSGTGSSTQSATQSGAEPTWQFTQLTYATLNCTGPSTPTPPTAPHATDLPPHPHSDMVCEDSLDAFSFIVGVPWLSVSFATEVTVPSGFGAFV